jgi:crotonobetainyl-CoA hydratase
MAYQFATYEKKDRLAIVTLNRPERMNALHPPANFELHEIWNDFEDDPEVWIGVLTGAGCVSRRDGMPRRISQAVLPCS